MDTKNYICPNCGAPLKFDASSQSLACEYCNSQFSTEEIDKIYNQQEDAQDGTNIDWKMPEQNESDDFKHFAAYNCPNCGAEIISDENTTATSCVYCGSPAIISKTAEGIYKPDYIIPFKLNKEDAKKALTEFYKGKVLLPKEFKNANQIDKITGLYVPFWLFDCDGNADINYTCTKVRSWSDSEYDYTKTSYYAVRRSGNIAFEKIPVDGSSKMPDNFMDSIEPFHYEDLLPFNISYLSGYMSDKYDVDASASKPRANERVENTIDAKFRSTVHNYNSVHANKRYIDMQGGQAKYVLLPVWMLNTSYKGKTYRFAMNGQTGKLVGNLPISYKRVFSIGAGITAATMLIGNIVSYFIL